MNCPKCNAAMNEVTVGEHAVDRCTGCMGLWFDLREHEHIAESRADVQAVDSGDSARGRELNAKREFLCPRCHVKMIQMVVPNQYHIQYESCPVCHGAFFDAGEFSDYASHTIGEQVASFFRGFRRKKAT